MNYSFQLWYGLFVSVIPGISASAVHCSTICAISSHVIFNPVQGLVQVKHMHSLNPYQTKKYEDYVVFDN